MNQSNAHGESEASDEGVQEDREGSDAAKSARPEEEMESKTEEHTRYEGEEEENESENDEEMGRRGGGSVCR